MTKTLPFGLLWVNNRKALVAALYSSSSFFNQFSMFTNGIKNSMALLVFVTICVLFACHNNTSATQEGEALAKQYCASCHQYPEPSLLDKTSWEQHVLPHMGHMLGIYEDENKRATLIENENTASVFPEQPLIEKADWEKIKNFYISQAPDKLNVPKVEIAVGLENFEVIKPAFTISPPSSTRGGRLGPTRSR